ncbi:flagellin lysine-N-methylase [Paenibacillus sp. CR_12]|uniref:flagellin lysine-N-methylase n=1 Tax=Paenibacillus sp. CR_12 TaxID=3055793 RepID=UPI0035C08E95
MKKNFVILKPQYMNEFQCIGSACSDTCCSGWKINIDKSTYKKYKKIKEKDVAIKITENIKKNKDSSAGNAAYIQTNGGACAFLQDGLCSIQLKFGEGFLSETCLTYPRVFNIVDQQVELSANMSCPETARLALLNKNLMEFDVVEEVLDTRFVTKKSITTKQSVWNTCLWEIRSLVIDMLQKRSFTVPDRMILLGLFCEKLVSVAPSDDRLQIINIVEEFRRRLDSPSTVNEISKLPRVTSIQLKFLIEVMQINTTITHDRFRNYISESIQAFGLDSSDESAIQSKYIHGCTEYYEPFINEHSYILENYLVNQVFQRLFLFRENSNILEEYLLLSILYSLMRFCLQGVAVYNKGMTPEKAVDVIQAFSKSIEHSSKYMNLLSSKVMNGKLDNWAFLITLLKE